jgi:DNA-binding NarL/FixJ family response regulator
MLSPFGAGACAERARRVLVGHRRDSTKAPDPAPDGLTTRVAQIARPTRDRLTNPEIGPQLFISHHAVEWHLRKVIAILGIQVRTIWMFIPILRTPG